MRHIANPRTPICALFDATRSQRLFDGKSVPLCWKIQENNQVSMAVANGHRWPSDTSMALTQSQITAHIHSSDRIISIGECGPWDGFATRRPPFNAGGSCCKPYTELPNTKFTRKLLHGKTVVTVSLSPSLNPSRDASSRPTIVPPLSLS